MKKLLILLIFITGCASYNYGRVEVKDIDSYINSAKKENIKIAVDPYDTPQKAQGAFYIDVTSKNFYPVNLIVENNSKEKILILKNSIELQDNYGNTFNPVNSHIMSDVFKKSKMAYALLGFGIFSYMSAEEANRKMQQDWQEKELSEQLIILPQRKTNGFVYFQLNNSPRGSKLYIQAEKLETKQKISFEIQL